MRQALRRVAMKFIRLLFVVLLCAALPVSVLAASGVGGECPMHDATPGGYTHTGASMHDCDTDKSSSQESKAKGAGCDASAQCQPGSLYHPVPGADVERPAECARLVVFHYAQSLTVREPGGPWRPPRAV